MKKKTRKNQRGSTFVFTMMVLAYVMVMGLTVAQIIFVEIAVSGDYANSVTAYYTAQGGLEDGLYEKTSKNSTSLENNSQYLLNYQVLMGNGFDSFLSSGRGMFSSVQRQKKVYYARPQIFPGWYHSTAFKSDGTIWSWGRDTRGQLGTGVVTNQTNYPVRSFTNSGSLPTNITAVSSGEQHVLALASDGTVYSWGYNSEGQLGDNTQQTTPIPQHVLRGAGSANGDTTYLGDGSNKVVAIAAGRYSSYAVKADGTVYSWGYNGNGALGVGSYSPRELVPVRVVDVGGTGVLTGIKAIANGCQHAVVLKYDGTVYSWGLGDYGQLGSGTPASSSISPVQVVGVGGAGILTGVVSVSAGSDNSAALKSDGTVYSWGRNDLGQLGINSNDGGRHSSPVQVYGPGGSGVLSGVKSVSVATRHTLALMTDGTAYSWGWNVYGQLGSNDSASDFVPYPVRVVDEGGGGALSDIFFLSGGWGFSTAMKIDGTVYSWGWNGYGQLGIGASDGFRHTIPIRVRGPYNVDYLKL